jgi:DNA-binding Lrp family transcriptional regulator
MSKQGAQLKQLSSPPITWLSEGRLKLSLLLRHEAVRTNRVSDALKCIAQEKFSPSKAYSEFPRIREPDTELIQAASDDYLRCVLAKSTAEVYGKMTPKYRNEAARKQFFQRLVEIGEAIHLSESFEGLHEAITPTKTDDPILWVNSELNRLVANKVDLSAEYVSRLNEARFEFKSFLKQLEKIIGFSWENSERFHQPLEINSFFPPGVFEGDSTWRWGSQMYPEWDTINVNPPILFSDTYRRGVLAREATILFSPRILDNMEHAPRVLCEQAEYLAYKMFERKNDKELWSEARHGLRQQTRFRGYELIDFFTYHEMLVGESLYRDVWSRLKEFGKARLALSDYYIIFNSLAARPTRLELNGSELKLLKLLSKRPDVRAGEAARILHTSVPTVMKSIRDLSRKAGLRFNVMVDMHRVGLVEELVLITAANQAEVIRILTRFPYCRQVFRIYGAFDIFCVMDLPQEKTSFTRGFLQRMVERKLVTAYRVVQLGRDLQALNFDHYDGTQRRWDIHWDSWGISLRESLSNADSQGFEFGNDEGKFEFDKLDLRILALLHHDCRLPFSSIGQSLGVSGAYVGRKVARLARAGIFRYAIWPVKIGAEDWGVLCLSCSKQTANTLAQYLSRLPAWRGGLVTGDFEGLVGIVWCPSGELKQLFKAIDDRLVRSGHAKFECLTTIGEWVVARWLPVEPYPRGTWDLYNDESGWIFDEQRYMSLLG